MNKVVTWIVGTIVFIAASMAIEISTSTERTKSFHIGYWEGVVYTLFCGWLIY